MHTPVATKTRLTDSPAVKTSPRVPATTRRRVRRDAILRMVRSGESGGGRSSPSAVRSISLPSLIRVRLLVPQCLHPGRFHGMRTPGSFLASRDVWNQGRTPLSDSGLLAHTGRGHRGRATNVGEASAEA